MRPLELLARLTAALFLLSAAGELSAASRPLLNPNCSEAKAGPQAHGCAPAFGLADLNGKPFNLSQLKGRVVLLHFWATWCEPCREEIATLVQLARTLGGKGQSAGVAIVAVSLDASAVEVRRFFNQQLPPFTLLLDPEQKSNTLYGTFKVPESYVIDRDGRIRDKIVGSRDWADGLTGNYLQCLARPTHCDPPAASASSSPR